MNLDKCVKLRKQSACFAGETLGDRMSLDQPPIALDGSRVAARTKCRDVEFLFTHNKSTCAFGWVALRPAGRTTCRRPLFACHLPAGFAVARMSFVRLSLSRGPASQGWRCRRKGSCRRRVNAPSSGMSSVRKAVGGNTETAGRCGDGDLFVALGRACSDEAQAAAMPPPLARIQSIRQVVPPASLVCQVSTVGHA